MTVYQELQLNQAGSKALIRSCTNRKDKMRHTAIYLFKICLTMAFCMAVVIGFSKIFGNGNSIVGVVVLLCVMAFRVCGFRNPDTTCDGSIDTYVCHIDFWPASGKCRGACTGISCKHRMYLDPYGAGLPQCGDVQSFHTAALLPFALWL